MARKKSQKVVCVINLKGGVGKSTIAALLAQHGFRSRGLDVLAIDLDPQANLSQALMRHRYNSFLNDARPSVVEIFNGYHPPTLGSGPKALGQDDGVETLWKIEDRTFQLIPSRFDFSDQLTNSIKPDPRILARFIGERFNHKDVIFIDCSPTESILTSAAYHASNNVLIPVKPEFFATVGFPLLQESLRKFRSSNRGHRISVLGVVINNAFYDGGNNGGPEKERAMQDIRTEALKNSWRIFDTEIPFSRGFPKMMRGDYTYQGNAYKFYQFANEFFDAL